MKKIRIDFPSFFKRGIKSSTDDYQVALINGSQGTGKSYYGIYLIKKRFSDRKIFTNIHSFKDDSLDITYFTKIDEIYNNHEKNAIFLIDELSKRYVKDSKIDLRFYSWLQQSRKHSRYVFLITQEYMQVPNWLRGVANLSYTTTKLPFGLIKTTLGVPILDKDTFDWALDEQAILIYKRNKKIADLYDTYELINEL